MRLIENLGSDLSPSIMKLGHETLQKDRSHAYLLKKIQKSQTTKFQPFYTSRCAHVVVRFLFIGT